MSEHFYELPRNTSFITHSAWINEEQISALSPALEFSLKLFPHVSLVAIALLSLAKSWYPGKCADITQECFTAYRAGSSVHRGLAEGLTHGEGDVGGADAGGRLDGQALSLLGDLHRRAGGGRHRNLPQEHIHTCAHRHTQTGLMSKWQLAVRWSAVRGMNVITAAHSSGFECYTPNNTF